jgi:hypothetical protein
MKFWERIIITGQEMNVLANSGVYRAARGGQGRARWAEGVEWSGLTDARLAGSQFHAASEQCCVCV